MPRICPGSLALRTDLEDLNSLVTLLIQTDKFGTSMAQALRVHSDSMRTNRFQIAEEIAAKLPVKLVFPLIFFVFPSLFVAVQRPAVIRILRVLFPALTGSMKMKGKKQTHESKKKKMMGLVLSSFFSPFYHELLSHEKRSKLAGRFFYEQQD